MTHNHTVVKVCGIKTRDVFEHLQDLQVEYVGFVFAPSKRLVTAEQVAALTAGLDHRSQRVGVFVNETAAEIQRIARVAGLDVLQLHGDESPAFAQDLREATGLAVWKAWGVTHDERDQQLAAYDGIVDAVLLDNERGGTGQRFSWEAIPALQALVPSAQLFVAGGLAPTNVGELVETYAPYGVDVSSGVETDGAKDPAKINQFVSKVRETR